MTPLPHENLLTAMGEVAAAFVGFLLIVGVLRARSIGSMDKACRVYSMRDVADIGLHAVLMSFLPLVIHAFGASSETNVSLGPDPGPCHLLAECVEEVFEHRVS